MTGSLRLFTNINRITGFNYYIEGKDDVIKSEIIKVTLGELNNFKRRSLMYPYLPTIDDTPFVVGYFESFNVIKIFVPRKVKQITPIDNEGNELLDYAGIFYDVSDSVSMFEYNIDKYIIMLESSLGEDLQNYFILLHENPNLDAHKEDFELIPNNMHDPSLIQKHFIELAYNTNIFNLLNNTSINTDASIIYQGAIINSQKTENYDNNELLLNVYDAGVIYKDSIIKNNFSINYLGGFIGYGEDLNITPEEIYAKWLPDQTIPSKEHGQWGRFKWKPNNL